MRLVWLAVALTPAIGYGGDLPDALVCSQIASCSAVVRDGDAILAAGNIANRAPSAGCAAGRDSGIFIERIRAGAAEPEWITCLFEGSDKSIRAMVRDREGRLVLGGTSEGAATVWRFDPAAREITGTSALPALGSYVQALALDISGDLFAGGYDSGTGFLARLDQTHLLPVWDTKVDTAPRSLAVTATGSLAALAGETALLLVKGADGAPVWRRTFSGVYPRAITAAGEDVWLVGDASAAAETTPDAWQATPGGTAYARFDFGYWFGQLSGLASHNIFAIAIHPVQRALMWTGTSGGVFRSDNNGWTWESRSTGLPTTAAVTGLVIDPQPPYALTALPALPAVLYRSLDEGITWNVTELPAEVGRVLSFARDPRDPAVLYAGGVGLWRSSDAGLTWMRILDAVSVAGISIDPANPQRLNAAYGFTGGGFPFSFSGGGVHHSEDGGVTWTGTNAYSPARQLLHDPAVPGQVWLLTQSGLLRSGDSGLTWTELRPPAPFAAIALNPEQPGALYTLRNTGNVYRSTDGGYSHELIAHGGWILTATALAVSEGGVVQAGGGAPPAAVLQRYSAAGDLLYSTLLSRDAGSYATAVEVRADGGITVGGQIWGFVESESGIRLMTFVAYADANGQMKAWVQPAQ